MAFVASWSVDSGPVRFLECDSCGDSVKCSPADGPDWRRLWQRALQRGWAGASTPTGRHHCPRCAGSIPVQATAVEATAVEATAVEATAVEATAVQVA